MASTTPLKWKFWVVVNLEVVSDGRNYHPLACVEQELKPGVNPPYAMGRFLRFLRNKENRLNVERDVNAFHLSASAPRERLPFLETMLLHAAAYDHVHGDEQVFSAVTLDPATAFEPHDPNISFGVVDISGVLDEDHPVQSCFVFPFGVHPIPEEVQNSARRHLRGKMQDWGYESLPADDYAKTFEGVFEMKIPDSSWRDPLWEPKDEVPLCCVARVLHATWHAYTHNIPWKINGYEGERGHTPTDSGDDDNDSDSSNPSWPKDRGVVVAAPPKPVGPPKFIFRPNMLKQANGSKLFSDKLRSENSTTINMTKFFYLITAANIGSILSDIDQDVRDKIEYIDVAKYKINAHILVQIARSFPNLKHINLMWNKALPAQTCFEVLEKTLTSQFKIQRITHHHLFRSATLSTAQMTSQPYYPAMRAMLAGQVTQIIYTSLRTHTAIPQDHDWLRLESGGLDWDHILGDPEADPDTFWACIPVREADMRSANWEIWWPKVIAFFKNKTLCNPYGATPTNILPRRRFFETFAHAMVLPYHTPGCDDDERTFEISPIPLGPYHHAAHLEKDATMRLEKFNQEMAFTLVIVAEDIGDERVLRHGFVTSAVVATEAKPFKVLSLEAYREVMDAPEWTIPDELKMEGEEHVCSQAEVETVLGPELLRLAFYGVKGVDKNRNVVFEGVPAMHVMSKIEEEAGEAGSDESEEDMPI